MRTAANIAIIGIFALAAQRLGLFVSSGLYLAAHMLFLGVRPGLAVAVALGATLVIWAFFGFLLGVEMRDAWLI